MTGRVIDSLAVSERFLWDLRQTISDLVVENYAGHGRVGPADMDCGFRSKPTAVPATTSPMPARADEPMGEFWMGGGCI